MSYVPPEKNAAYIFYVSLVSQANTKIMQANPTLAAGDVKVATDDAAPGNLTTLPAVDADFTKRVKVSMSAGEMNGDNVTIIFSDAAGSEWCDLTINLQTVTRQIDDLAFPTTSGRSIDVTATGCVGIDWANVEGQATTVDLSDTSINLCDTVTTLTGHTAQTGDSFARIGAAGASLSAIPWNAAWDAEVESECTDALNTYDPPTKAEMDAGHGLLATEAKQDIIDGIVDDILVDTAEIGAAGAGLTEAGGTGDQFTAIPWNVAWDAEVESECTDALNAYDPPTDAEMLAAFAALNDPTAGDVADAVWDELQVDHVGVGTFGIIASEIADILVDTAEIGAAGAGLTEAGGTGDQLTAVPWNAAWDAEVESEVDDSLATFFTSSAQLVDDIWDELQADHVGVGTMGLIASEIADILVDTAEIGAAGVGLTEAGGTGDQLTAVPWNAAWDAEVESEVVDGLGTYTAATAANVSAVETDTQDIQARLPAALVGGLMSSDVTAISTDTTAADRLEALMDGIIVAQINDAAATTTDFAADGFVEATDDHFNGRLITFITGDLAGQQTDITDYDAAGGAQGNQQFTVTALTEAPSDGDYFVIH